MNRPTVEIAAKTIGAVLAFFVMFVSIYVFLASKGDPLLPGILVEGSE